MKNGCRQSKKYLKQFNIMFLLDIYFIIDKLDIFINNYTDT